MRSVVKNQTFVSKGLKSAAITSLTALLILASAGLSSAQQKYDQTGPWWAKLPRPLLGMDYSPEPSDYINPANTCTNKPYSCKYFDDDFFNADFPLLWGATGASARNDLGTIQGMGMNFLHLYNFSGCRNHLPFLSYANSQGISVMIPVSSYFVNPAADPNRTKDIQALFNEIYGVSEGGASPNPAAALWDIGNEYDNSGLSADDVASAVQIIVDYEEQLHITDANKLLFTSPVSFGTYGRPNHPAIVKLQELQNAFAKFAKEDPAMANIWYTRFVASINPFNPGTYMANYLKKTYPQSMSSGGTTLPLFFSEYGQDAHDACFQLHPNNHQTKCATTAQQNAAQATYETTQINKVLPLAKSARTSRTGYFYGFSIFQWQNEFFYTGSQAEWGVLEQGAPPSGQGTIAGGVCGIPSNSFTYPVDPLNDKPNFAAIVQAIK
jgi:hypothetical protein